jgi:hypothetical protein
LESALRILAFDSIDYDHAGLHPAILADHCWIPTPAAFGLAEPDQRHSKVCHDVVPFQEEDYHGLSDNDITKPKFFSISSMFTVAYEAGDKNPFFGTRSV